MAPNRILAPLLLTMAGCATAMMLHSRVQAQAAPGLTYEPTYELQYSLSYQP